MNITRNEHIEYSLVLNCFFKEHLNKLSAEIHTYLDINHNDILISIPYEAIQKYMERDLPLPVVCCIR